MLRVVIKSRPISKRTSFFGRSNDLCVPRCLERRGTAGGGHTRRCTNPKDSQGPAKKFSLSLSLSLSNTHACTHKHTEIKQRAEEAPGPRGSIECYGDIFLFHYFLRLLRLLRSLFLFLRSCRILFIFYTPRQPYYLLYYTIHDHKPINLLRSLVGPTFATAADDESFVSLALVIRC